MSDVVNFGFKDVVFKEGAPATKLFLVKSGEVLCMKASKDRLIPVFMARRGDIIGENAIVQDLTYTYSAISMDSTELVEVSSLNFKEVLLKTPNWVTELMTTMISRFQSTANLLAENRMVHPTIIGEDQFTPQIENDFKKLLS